MFGMAERLFVNPDPWRECTASTGVLRWWVKGSHRAWEGFSLFSSNYLGIEGFQTLLLDITTQQTLTPTKAN
jgi:hypothetical protein